MIQPGANKKHCMIRKAEKIGGDQNCKRNRDRQSTPNGGFNQKKERIRK